MATEFPNPSPKVGPRSSGSGTHTVSARNISGAAFTFLELLCIMAATAVLGAMLLAGWGNARERARRIQCAHNLTQLGAAFANLASDTEARSGRQGNNVLDRLAADGMVFKYFLAYSNALSGPKILFCPAESDLMRKPASAFTDLTNDNQVSYFVGLGGDERTPQMLLHGDHNLSINGVPARHGVRVLSTNDLVVWAPGGHHGQGNVLLCDGSVQQYSASRLLSLVTAGLATNSIAFP